MKRAIITGATGAIGTALIEELISADIEILVFIRENSQRKDNIKNHPLIQKRYCSLDHLAEIRNETGKEYDVFYHLAWAGSSGTGRNDMYMQNLNVNMHLMR